MTKASPRTLDISVVIPAYNAKSTILRTLDSVLQQSMQPNEVIIIDDGSDDGTFEAVSCYLKDARVVYERQSNSGVSSARNRGVERSIGKYIAFLDADDYWHEDYLSNIDDAISKFSSCAVYAAGVSFVYPDGSSKSSRKLPWKDGDVVVVDDYLSIASRGFKLITSSSVVVEREAFLKAEGFQVGISSGEDLLLWVKLTMNNKLCFINKILCFAECPLLVSDRPARVHETTDHVSENLLDLLSIYPNVSLKKYIGHWFEMRAVIFLERGRRKIAFTNIIKSVFYGGLSIKKIGLAVFLFLPQALFLRQLAKHRKN